MDRPIQLGPTKRPDVSTEEKKARAQQAFSQLSLGDEDEDEDTLLAHAISKQEESKAAEAELDGERAVTEKKHQRDYLRKQDELAEAHLEQYERDKRELKLLKDKELRLQAMQTRAQINSREEQQCSLGMAALLDQKDTLIQRFKKRMEMQKKMEALKQAIQADLDKDEEPS